MSNLPRVRWLVLMFVVVFVAVLLFQGLGIAETLRQASVLAVGIASALLAAARLAVVALAVSDEDDPMYHTMTRESRQTGQSFWGRVW